MIPIIGVKSLSPLSVLTTLPQWNGDVRIRIYGRRHLCAARLKSGHLAVAAVLKLPQDLVREEQYDEALPLL